LSLFLAFFCCRTSCLMQRADEGERGEDEMMTLPGAIFLVAKSCFQCVYDNNMEKRSPSLFLACFCCCRTLALALLCWFFGVIPGYNDTQQQTNDKASLWFTAFLGFRQVDCPAKEWSMSWLPLSLFLPFCPSADTDTDGHANRTKG